MSIDPPLPAAVLFDLDGTLIDSEGLWWVAECRVVAGLGGQWSPQDQQECLGGPLERVSTYMAQLTGTSVPVEEIGRRLLDEMEALLREGPLEWRPGAPELVRACHAQGVPTALVSASYRQLLHAVTEVVDRETGGRSFDVSVAGDEVSDSKPHPEPYLTAAALLGVNIADCVVIEDSPTGVAAGQASGAYVVAVPHMVDIEQAPRRTVCRTLSGVSLQDLARWMTEDHR